jgi:hypothetical protein
MGGGPDSPERQNGEGLELLVTLPLPEMPARVDILKRKFPSISKVTWMTAGKLADKEDEIRG